MTINLLSPRVRLAYHEGIVIGILKSCFQCHSKIEWLLEQHTSSGYLFWRAMYRCPHCGNYAQWDELGLLPSSARQTLLEQKGRFDISIIYDGAEERVEVRKALRRVIGMSRDTSRALPWPRIWQGTQIEGEWLQTLLQIEGIPVTVTRV